MKICMMCMEGYHYSKISKLNLCDSCVEEMKLPKEDYPKENFESCPLKFIDNDWYEIDYVQYGWNKLKKIKNKVTFLLENNAHEYFGRQHLFE